MADTYDETFLGNATVPNTGKTVESSGAPSPPKTTNSNPANEKADGTASPRITTTTKMAAANSTPSGGKDQRPNIDSYTDKAGEDPGHD
jgi:hypothetical protein